jgi:MSHA biogenesis protein MshQ
MRLRSFINTLLLASCGLVATPGVAGPGDVLFEDEFDDLSQWSIAPSGGSAGIDNATGNSPPTSLRLSNGNVAVTSGSIDAAVPAASFELWVRRGLPDQPDCVFGLTCTTDPESGEDLLVEYLSASNNWVALTTFQGGGTEGEILTHADDLPADALHANLRIRITMTDGDSCSFLGLNCDYWYIDDAIVTELGPAALPFGLGGCDDFENGIGNWSGTDSDRYGINSMTSNSPSNSLYLRGGGVTVTSVPIDLSGGLLVSLDLWVRKGGNFSELPNSNRNLELEYRASGGNWVDLDTFAGGGTAGQIYVESYALAADALHSGFQLRLRHTGPNGGSDNRDYWHIDDVCLSSLTPISYSFEEASWTGAPGEVQDGSGSGLNGTAHDGAQSSGTSPALTGNPGSCRYGVFDGTNDHIQIADNPALDISNELTVAAWINMRSYPPELHTIVSKDENYEYHIDTQGRVYWWWERDNFTTNGFSIGLNQWYHVAITYRSGSQTIYVNGVSQATNNDTGALPQNNDPVFIGTDLDFDSRTFDGFIDEVHIIPRELSQSQVQSLMNERHPCATAAAEFTLNHDGFGINCLAETIAVNVIDSVAGTPLTSYNADVVLDTQTGSGSWALFSGGGTLTDSVPGDGVAVYAWPLNEPQAVFTLSYPGGDPIIGNIEVVQQSDPGIRDDNSDGSLVFSPNGFTLTATQLGNPPPATIPTFAQAQTAGQAFALHITAYGEIPNDPVCGVIEAYDGVKNLQFWSSYLNPSSGSRAVQVDTGIESGPIAGSEAGAGVQLASFASGRAEVLVRYKDVGSLQIAVKDDSVNTELPTGIRGATAGFVSRPATFELSNIANAAGTKPNPAAADAFGLAFIGAGTNFQATVTALDADGDPTPNYGREAMPEGVRLSVDLVAPAGGASPGIGSTVGFGAFSGGIATGTDFYWPEVGIVRLVPAVADADYLGAGDVVGIETANIGRFVPDHFALGLNAPFLQTQCAAGSFTYAGQSFGYAVAPVITATARAATSDQTFNYTGDFFKMRTADLANRSYTSASGLLDPAGVPPAAVDPTVTETAPGVATLVFGSGAGLSFDRTSVPSPFAADIRLSLEVYDEDAVAAASNPATFGLGGGIAFTDGAGIRYGRLRFTNAVGSERVDLPVPLAAEYFAGPGIGFVANVADSCTTNLALTLGGFTENLSAGETCVLDTGFPGASGAGCAAAAPLPQQFAEPPLAGDFNLTLAAPGPGNHGSLRIDATAPAWLRFDWDASLPGDENPSGYATFGLYDGDPAQIYLRELYY